MRGLGMAERLLTRTKVLVLVEKTEGGGEERDHPCSHAPMHHTFQPPAILQTRKVEEREMVVVCLAL